MYSIVCLGQIESLVLGDVHQHQDQSATYDGGVLAVDWGVVRVVSLNLFPALVQAMIGGRGEPHMSEPRRGIWKAIARLLRAEEWNNAYEE